MNHDLKQYFLEKYDEEHERTMRVLRAYPEDKLDLRPNPKASSARQVAWTFVLERGLGVKVWNDEFAKGMPGGGSMPKPPEDWNEMLGALEAAHKSFRDLVASASDEELEEKVHFFTAPKTMGEISRIDWVWFLLFDQIHHRGQFSTYLRLADAKVPSIYGPSADEPWN